MPVHNTDIAELFRKIADLLAIEGENKFRIRAYRNAAQTIDGLSKNVAEMIDRGEDLSKLSGIGDDLADKIETFVDTGSLPQLEKLEKKIPVELVKLMKIRGLGAKRVRALYEKLNIRSVEDLSKAAEEGEISNLEGFGKKTEQAIMDEIGRLDTSGKRTMIFKASEIAHSLIDYLEEIDGVKELVVAGSYRRGKETVGDLDILIVTKRGVNASEHFVEYEDIKKVLSRGESKSSVLLDSGMQVDLRSVPAVSFGAALLYFTGSKAHNISLRKIAQKKSWKVNEYGLFDGDDRIAGRTEKQIYEKLGLEHIDPELREDRGEIEAARKGSLPDLITRKDVRGDLHVHTNRTDGHYSLEQMAEAAKKRNLDYIAITDHSKHVSVTGGLDADALAEQIDEIEEKRSKIEGIDILTGIEVDILEDGSLDLPDEILKKLDVVVCSIHSKFGLSKKKQTERVLKAMDNDLFQIFGHPTGRMIGTREPYDIDIEKVLRRAKERGCFMELNAHPERLDLDDAHCKTAKDMGVKIAISTDAHHTDDFDFLEYGVKQARRGWLEANDVINTFSPKRLRKILKKT